jgi:PAS domain S-box-containing protein
MSGGNPHLFGHRASLRVRQVELNASDDVQHQREKLARIVMDEMYQFVALLDVQGTLLEVNRAALEGAGLRLEDTCGKPFWEVRWWTVSRESQQQLQEAVKRAAAGAFVRYDVEVYGEASGEETIIIDFSLNPVKDTEGRVVFLLAEGRNITEKKRAEAEIARKNQELQRLLDRVRELDELKSQFFANVSHELRTPLALILGPAEQLLSQGDNLTELQRRDLEVMRRNASTLLKQVNNLLDLSKLDAGRMQASYAQVDLARLVRTVAGHFDALAPQRSIRYVIDTPDTLPAQVDPDKLERVLLNLLSNAFKFVPEGGRIKCGLRPTPEGRALLSVQDSGPGVKPELRQTIFERFRQGEAGSTRQFGGTGLGLSIAKDFVELHGGTVTLTDAPGGGALFLVEVPLLAPEATRVRKAAEPTASTGDAVLQGTLEELKPVDIIPRARPEGSPDRPLVLVVEDNLELNRFITETLSEEFRVQAATDGQQGLERAREQAPDLIVSDLMMPRLSGDQLIARLREDEALADVPVLVLSAKADDALRLRLLREGAQDYMVKPFSAEELVARVRNLVALKRTRDILQRELTLRSRSVEELAREAARRKQQLERTLEEARIARLHAESASRAKSDLLNLLSHELNSPITAVMLALDTVQRNGFKPENMRSFERLRGASKRLKALVAGLLDQARANAGTLALQAEPIDVGALVGQLLEELEPEAQQHGLQLRSSLAGVPPLMSDPPLVRAILVNLVGNALKYTQQGWVEVSVRHEPHGHLFEVRDTGPGIAREHWRRIFEPFEQLEPLRHKSTPGLGLGLALVKQLVEALQGQLELTSELGVGSTFRVVLPSLDAVDTRGPAPLAAKHRPSIPPA